jgi:hypothetical protein
MFRAPSGGQRQDQSYGHCAEPEDQMVSITSCAVVSLCNRCFSYSRVTEEYQRSSPASIF